jgi:ubiquinone/menaquinone biosynthesis C-methylase UbiE
VTKLLSSLQLPPRAKLLDVGAGTGKFTELLVARDESEVAGVIAVEPHDGMRETLVGKKLERVVVGKGYATALPLEVGEGKVDGVLIAQAFHWFATKEALHELARVLRSRGWLGVIWNIEDYNNTLEHWSPHPWTLKLRQFLFARDTKEDSVRFRNERWRVIFEQDDIPFGKLTEASETWTKSLTDEELWARWQTLSQIAEMNEGSPELKEAREYFEEAIKGEGTERDADGRIIVRGVTICGWTQKKS